jgi:hypothetical protein
MRQMSPRRARLQPSADARAWNSKMIVPIVAVLLVPVLGHARAPAHAQSLADLARQEEERRKSIKEPSRLYTNKDLPTVAPPTAPPVAPKSEPTAVVATQGDVKTEPTTSAADQADKADKKDQAYWSAGIARLRDQLDRNQTLAEAVQSRINALTTDFVNRDDPAQRAVVATDRQKALGELDRLRKAVESDKKAIADFEEQARRAGVPPGWLR